MGEAKQKKARGAGPIADPAYQRSLFTQSFDQTCKAISKYSNPVDALLQTYRGRNAALDLVIQVHGPLNKAECHEGCASCCHQMVLCAPFEVFIIARRLLDTKPPDELDDIKCRLEDNASLPLEPNARYGASYPCALLQKNRCSIYDERPSVCRTMLSASRAACDACLASKTPGTIPYVAIPMQVNAIMELAIDYALATRLGLSTERVELSRAILVALADFEEALAIWERGGDPFPECHARPSRTPSNREMAEAAAKRFGLI